MFHLFSKNPAVSWLICGLGNPGRQYEKSRHNAGFRALDLLAGRHGIAVNRARFHGLCGLGEIRGQRVLLLKPDTFMNESGKSVRAAAAYYRVPTERILVIADDVSLAEGKLRVRAQGSAGGHNGLKSVIDHLCDLFPRVKIGVGAPPPGADLVAWVLGSPRPNALRQAEERAAELVELVLEKGVAAANEQANC